jgi:hypothetical protein
LLFHSVEIKISEKNELEFYLEFINFNSFYNFFDKTLRSDYSLVFLNPNKNELVYAVDPKENETRLKYSILKTKEKISSIKFMPLIFDNIFRFPKDNPTFIQIHEFDTNKAKNPDKELEGINGGDFDLKFPFGKETNVVDGIPENSLRIQTFLVITKGEYQLEKMLISENSDPSCKEEGKLCLGLDFYIPKIKRLKETAKKIEKNLYLNLDDAKKHVELQDNKSYSFYCFSKKPMFFDSLEKIKVEKYISDDSKDSEFFVFYTDGEDLNNLQAFECQTSSNRRNNFELITGFIVHPFEKLRLI